MKIEIKLSPNRNLIPYNYTHQLTGLFHHWLGPNKWHSQMSLYSLGWLRGGKSLPGGLLFPNGAYWEIGVYDDELTEKLIGGFLTKDFEFYGMNVIKADRIPSPSFDQPYSRFLAGSPIITRAKPDASGYRAYHLYNDPESERIMQRVLYKKMMEADLIDQIPHTKIYYDRSFANPKTKMITIKGIKNRGSVCPVIVEGPPIAQEFAWVVGAGELTGSGFGSLLFPRKSLKNSTTYVHQNQHQ